MTLNYFNFGYWIFEITTQIAFARLTYLFFLHLEPFPVQFNPDCLPTSQLVKSNTTLDFLRVGTTTPTWTYNSKVLQQHPISWLSGVIIDRTHIHPCTKQTTPMYTLSGFVGLKIHANEKSLIFCFTSLWFLCIFKPKSKMNLGVIVR